jgi:hypothetical protein
VPDITERPTTPDDIAAALAEYFHPNDVQFKPGVVRGNSALALAYIDARQVMDRLDRVVGVGGWQDDYEAYQDGSVGCRLRVRIGDQWITKMDVGGESEQLDGGDRRKAAFSDALKRTAVKFGIGRELYEYPVQWVDYDPQKKQFAKRPTFPDFVLKPRQSGPAEKPNIAPRPMTEEETAAFDRWVAKLETEVVDLDSCNAAYDTYNTIPVEKRLLRSKCWEALRQHAKQLDFILATKSILPDGGIGSRFQHKPRKP